MTVFGHHDVSLARLKLANRLCRLFLFHCRGTAIDRYFHHTVPRILVPFLKQIVRDIVAVAEPLDALATRIGLTLVTDEEPLKIFTAVHRISLFMITARRYLLKPRLAIRQFWTLTAYHFFLQCEACH